ncbi:MAG TPA: aminotransferase class I/II-fold pyridoxal phosphate-dependent enzyme, partial [Enhygromyxa sp.]|nr:aminotransferase class I/II-fold pyridoxal phosphate-dependent enzyme [Enhygromyxa sp.]
MAAFDSGWIAPLGPQVDAFERSVAQIVQRQAGAATASGTAALHLGLRLLDVRPGDEVWVSTATFVASVTPITWLGATPVFVDSERRTWNMDPERLDVALAIAAAIDRLPRAVVVVDIYGQCADWQPILEVCAKYSVPVLEDAAEALGARDQSARPAGSFGQLAAISFNGNKLVTCGGGGMLVGDDVDQIAQARWLAAQARELAPHYEHVTLGYNYRLSNVLAGLGLGQLGRLDELVAARRTNFQRYCEGLSELPGVEFMPEPEGWRSTRWLTVMLLDREWFGLDPEALREALAAADIEARPVWKPMHMQPAFAGCRRIGGEVAEDLFVRGLHVHGLP